MKIFILGYNCKRYQCRWCIFKNLGHLFILSFGTTSHSLSEFNYPLGDTFCYQTCGPTKILEMNIDRKNNLDIANTFKTNRPELTRFWVNQKLTGYINRCYRNLCRESEYAYKWFWMFLKSLFQNCFLVKIPYESFAPNNLNKRPSNLFKRPNNTFYSPRCICLSAQILLPLYVNTVPVHCQYHVFTKL